MPQHHVLLAAWEPAQISRAWLMPRWKAACELAEITPLDVVIDADKKLVQFVAMRDDRNGAAAGFPAMFLTQPGGHYGILGCALQLKEEFMKVNELIREPAVIVDFGAIKVIKNA